MGIRHTDKIKILLWILIVYIMSFICYTPSLLEQHEIYLPLRLFRIKYLFVYVPAITTILLLLYEHGLMRYFINIFSGKVAVQHILYQPPF